MEKHCFSAERRLKKPAEFSAVYKNNQTRVKGQYFTVLAFCHSNRNENTSNEKRVQLAKLGVVVSKKVSKRAVKRNKFKRLVRESFRNLNHPDNYDFVVIARPETASADNDKIIKELHKLWQRLHQRCDML